MYGTDGCIRIVSETISHLYGSRQFRNRRVPFRCNPISTVCWDKDIFSLLFWTSQRNDWTDAINPKVVFFEGGIKQSA